MKIRTDVNDIIPQKSYVKPATKPPILEQQNAVLRQNLQVSNEYATNIMNKLHMDRSLSDALSIAQVSQNLIQKAMVVSSRLRDIASQAIATGKVDSDALNVALGGIDNAIQKYGENVVQPVQTTYRNNQHIASLPLAANDLNNLRETGQNMKQGTIPKEGTIDALDFRLNNNLEQVQKFQDTIVTGMNKLVKQYPDFSGTDMNQLSAQVKNAIVENPALALQAQGNINPQVVGQVV